MAHLIRVFRSQISSFNLPWGRAPPVVYTVPPPAGYSSYYNLPAEVQYILLHPHPLLNFCSCYVPLWVSTFMLPINVMLIFSLIFSCFGATISDFNSQTQILQNYIISILSITVILQQYIEVHKPLFSNKDFKVIADANLMQTLEVLIMF
jgi:hypothetical protein